jgi:hypothetical protein
LRPPNDQEVVDGVAGGRGVDDHVDAEVHAGVVGNEAEERLELALCGSSRVQAEEGASEEQAADFGGLLLGQSEVGNEGVACGLEVLSEDAELAQREQVFAVEFFFYQGFAALPGAGDSDTEGPLVGLGEVVR